jgi:hypothetical protein
MGHLLLHLYAREKWKLDVMSESSKKKLLDPSFELKGLTDLDLPCNWALYHEANTVSFILGKPFEGSWAEALKAINTFVYEKPTPTSFTEDPQ